MKRKLLNAVLLTSALVGVGTLSSCKDYEEDLRNEWRQSNLTLEEKIAKLNENLDIVKTAQEACKKACEDQFKIITQKITDLENYNKVQDGVTAEQANAIAELRQKLENLALNPPTPAGLAQTVAEIQAALAQAGITTSATSTTPSGINVKELKDELERLALLVKNYTVLEQDVANIKAYTDGLPAVLADLQQQIQNIQPGISEEKARELAREEATKIVEAKVQKLNDDLAALSQTVTALKGDVEKNAADVAALKNTVTNNYNDLAGQIGTVSQTVTNNYNDLTAKYNSLLENYNNLSTLYTAINGKVSAIESELSGIKGRLTTAEANALSALNKANENKVALDVMQATIEGFQPAIDALEARVKAAEDAVKANTAAITLNKAAIEANAAAIEALQQELAQAKADIAALKDKAAALESRIGALETLVAGLASQADLDALVALVAQNADAITVLNTAVGKLAKIYDRLNAQITGITVQRVVNPLFGSISTPLGIETSVLVNFWGKYEGAKDLVFPSNRAVEGLDNMLSEADAKVLAGLYSPVTIKNNQYLVEDCGLGNVYLTINPSNVNFTGGDLALESSAQNACGVELRNVRRSNEELTFGISKAADNGNGFYVADAYLPATAEAINRTKIELTPGLKAAVKDVVTDRSKQAVFNLFKKVYKQVTLGQPAYGVKASWSADDGNGMQNFSVYSQYNIMATCFRPLSYNTLADVSINHRFPTFGPRKAVIDYLNEYFTADKFHFNLGTPNINVNGVNFDFQLGEFTLSADGVTIQTTSPGVKVTMEIDGQIHTTTTDPFTVTIGGSDLKPLMDQLNAQLNAQVSVWNTEMHNAFDSAMTSLINDLQSQVNNMMLDLEAKINDQIGNILTDIKSDLAGTLQPFMNKVNFFIEEYNVVANQLNRILAHPNNYLQVAMLYRGGNNGLAFLSNNPMDPTIATNNGGSGLMLYATSYTAEIAAPAFHKFVAITNVTDTKGNSAKGGNAALLADLKALNKAGSMCQVMTGRTKRIALPTQNMKKGYTYEIVYTAVDYHGYTSTQHFYVKIK